ncbi:MAG: hypothetical protein WAK17_07475 [Candidatus Nitrosopolaris sp.]
MTILPRIALQYIEVDVSVETGIARVFRKKAAIGMRFFNLQIAR